MAVIDIVLALRDAGCTEALSNSADGVFNIGAPAQGARLWVRDGRVHYRYAPAGGTCLRGDADTVADAWTALSALLPDRELDAALALVRARGYTVTAPGARDPRWPKRATFKLVLGDWSGDGHSQTSSRAIQTDLTRDEVCAAVSKAQVELGLGNENECAYSGARLLVASKYEDAEAPSAEVRAALGFEFSEPEFREPEDTYMTEDDFVNLWLRIARRGARPDAVLELVPEAPSICIGGYGLFS